MAAAQNSGLMRPLERRSPQNTLPTSYATFVAKVFVPAYKGKGKLPDIHVHPKSGVPLAPNEGHSALQASQLPAQSPLQSTPIRKFTRTPRSELSWLVVIQSRSRTSIVMSAPLVRTRANVSALRLY